MPTLRAKGGPKKEQYELLKTSLAYHTQLYFDKSTLHGVRYIKERGRPSSEKLLWFCCAAISLMVTIIIIVSLWEKFQTEPTITGLDADFHTWDVPFPAVALCPSHPYSAELVRNYVDQKYKGDEFYKRFLIQAVGFSYSNMDIIGNLSEQAKSLPRDTTLRELQKVLSLQCPELLRHCVLNNNPLEDCCEKFHSMPTEVGMCYVYNSRHIGDLPWKGQNSYVDVDYISENDNRWALQITVADNLTVPSKQAHSINVYLISNDEVPTVDMEPHLRWDFTIQEMKFSVKHTYTTAGTRELTVRQRKCLFSDEYRLLTDDEYTYSTCMSECRMKLARTLCGCVPSFYMAVEGYKYCTLENMKCLADNANTLLRVKGEKCGCELGCLNTVYAVENFKSYGKITNTLDMSFVSWPLIRYKREVLFGWADLLVSFGGIAGLFLGFSLLSGVEVVYYFTMRACCMVLHNREELKQLQQEYATEKKPPLNLSLTPYFMKEDKDKKGMGIVRVHGLKVPTVSGRVEQLFPLPIKRRNNLRPPGLFLEYLP